MNNPIVLAALIAAIPATLAIVGGMGRYIVTTILDAYKGQATATIGAKDAEIHILERMLDEERRQHTEDRADDRAEIARLHDVTEQLRLALRAQAT